MATRGELEVAGRCLYLAVNMTRAETMELARLMLEAAEEVRMHEMQKLFGGTPCKECGTLHFKRE